MFPLSTRLSRHATDFIDDARLRGLVESKRLCDVFAVRDIVADLVGSSGLSEGSDGNVTIDERPVRWMRM